MRMVKSSNKTEVLGDLATAPVGCGGTVVQMRLTYLIGNGISQNSSVYVIDGEAVRMEFTLHA
jgi:hypothetical protein